MMAVKRITMQDIADACGLSRNTVSKIFNNRGAVPAETRKLVFQTAQDLGYGQFTEEMPKDVKKNTRNVALLTQHKLLSHNFGAFFLTGFTDQISRSGFTMRMFEATQEELAAGQLPPQLDLSDAAAILCIELFDRAYLNKVSALGLPCVIVDGYAGASNSLLCCDLISMENNAAVIAMTERMIAAGATRIGFVGDKDHCNSFFERWVGFTSAMANAGLPVDRKLCILDTDCDDYGNVKWLSEKLDAMHAIPDGFVCANDFLAIHLMSALKKRGLRIPEDVMVTGFDGSLEASMVEPPLTTAQIPSTEIGRLAATRLIERLQTPNSAFRWIIVKTTPIWGGSTR